MQTNRLSADPAARLCLVEAEPTVRNPSLHLPFGLGVMAHMRWLNRRNETAFETGHMNTTFSGRAGGRWGALPRSTR